MAATIKITTSAAAAAVIAAFGAYTHNVWITHHCWIIADHWLRSFVLSLFWHFSLNNARSGCCCCYCFCFCFCCCGCGCRYHRCCYIVIVVILTMFNGDQLMMKSYNGLHLYFIYLLHFKRAGTCGIRMLERAPERSHTHTHTADILNGKAAAERWCCNITTKTHSHKCTSDLVYTIVTMKSA